MISRLYLDYKYKVAGPSDRAVYDVDLRPLTCWACGFETHRGYGWMSGV